MQNFPSQATVTRLRTELKGKRIKFLAHGEPDPQPLTPGSEGLVEEVDDAGTIQVKWDNGRGLGLVYGVDQYCRFALILRHPSRICPAQNT